MSRTSYTITYKGELVDDPDAGNFYYKVTPKIKEGRTKLDDRERKQIVNEIKRAVQEKLKRIKL